MTGGGVAIEPRDWFEAGFGPCMVSVAPVGAQIAQGVQLRQADLGKAPAILTHRGWVPKDLRAMFCRSLDEVKLWKEGWGANFGQRLELGRAVYDNDQGKEFSLCFREAFKCEGVEPMRRYVNTPGHERDAFYFQVRDFVGDPVQLPNLELRFRQGVAVAKVSLLAQNKQFVVFGTHPSLGSYVWDRALEDGDPPIIADVQFREITLEAVRRIGLLGWVLETPLPYVWGGGGHKVSYPAGSSTSASAIAVSQVGPGVSQPGVATVYIHVSAEEVRAILDLIPNRDKPDPEKTDLDRYLDDYNHWIEICYAIIGALGATPEARALWIEWSNERAQPGQSPYKVWESAVRAPPRLDLRHLVGLAKRFAPRAYARLLWDGVPELPDDDDDPRALWEQVRDRYCYDCSALQFTDYNTSETMPKQGFDDKYARQMAAFQFEKWGKVARKRLTMSQFFLNEPDATLVRGRTYSPGEPVIVHDLPNTLPLVNSWRPSREGFLSSVPVAQIQRWLDLVEFVLGPGEVERFLRWAAFLVQRPKEKPNWHWLVISPQGYGKDTMLLPLRRALGRDNVREIMVADLTGQYTEFLECKLLIISETRQVANGFSTAHDNGAKFKHLFAKPPEFMTVNHKYGRRYEIPNTLGCVLFSNERNPVHLEEDQRRVHVIKRHDPPKPAAYYAGVWAWLEADGAELAASYLREYPLPADIDDEMKAAAPTSPAKKELEETNRHPLHVAIDLLIEEARLGYGEFASLLATQETIRAIVQPSLAIRVSAQAVGDYLHSLEEAKQGVHRIKEGLNGGAGVVGDGKTSARLWALGDTLAGGRDWQAMTAGQLIDLWRGRPVRSSAAIFQFPPVAAAAGDEDEQT